jgi:signal transduction histidine kinase
LKEWIDRVEHQIPMKDHHNQIDLGQLTLQQAFDNQKRIRHDLRPP